ncbi:hypothetical protein K439DRAFT_46141 [Ramaria rubella]|nr:hypothetical protein K439DRAFT_46141 [Ramaria rubella]
MDAFPPGPSPSPSVSDRLVIDTATCAGAIPKIPARFRRRRGCVGHEYVWKARACGDGDAELEWKGERESMVPPEESQQLDARSVFSQQGVSESAPPASMFDPPSARAPPQTPCAVSFRSPEPLTLSVLSTTPTPSPIPCPFPTLTVASRPASAIRGSASHSYPTSPSTTPRRRRLVELRTIRRFAIGFRAELQDFVCSEHMLYESQMDRGGVGSSCPAVHWNPTLIHCFSIPLGTHSLR